MTMRYDTHVCLVSDQPTPNLSPALDPTFSPGRVVLVVSPDMKIPAHRLSNVLKRHSIEVEFLEISDAYDFNACWERMANWLSHQNGEVALNATGGTKVMAMAAQDVFREIGRPTFYINIQNDEVIRLDRRDSPFVLPTKIKLREYLEAHGYSILGKPSKPDIKASLRNFTDRLIIDSDRLGNALGRLNWLAHQAEKKLVSPVIDKIDSALDELILMFSNEALLIRGNDDRLRFPDEDARQFVNGGWLEYLTYHALAQIAPEIGITDYAISLEVLAPDGKTKNELDAVFLYQNTLHIIECKTANLVTSVKGGDNKATDALYKLDSLRDLGGLRTKGMLLDYRGGLNDFDKGRARQMQLKIISGSQLRDLRGEIKGWLKPNA